MHFNEDEALAVRCKTVSCGAKIPLGSAMDNIFPMPDSITILVCPIGHRHEYTEADVIDTSAAPTRPS
jgi:hypothetical protein